MMVRACFFDAVGTLLHPEPSAAQVYAEVGKRFGSRLEAPMIRRAFGVAFSRQEQLDREQGWRTSEARERQRWQAIVAEVLPDVTDPAGCFAELYDHFQRPSQWRVDEGARPVIGELLERGIAVGIASNFDERLRKVLAGWSVFDRLNHVVISSEVGWRKPAPQFFEAVARSVGCEPRDIVFVGDDPINDYEGARAAGMEAILLGARAEPGQAAIGLLGDLTGRLWKQKSRV